MKINKEDEEIWDNFLKTPIKAKKETESVVKTRKRSNRYDWEGLVKEYTEGNYVTISDFFREKEIPRGGAYFVRFRKMIDQLQIPKSETPKTRGRPKGKVNKQEDADFLEKWFNTYGSLSREEYVIIKKVMMIIQAEDMKK